MMQDRELEAHVEHTLDTVAARVDVGEPPALPASRTAVVTGRRLRTVGLVAASLALVAGIGGWALGARSDHTVQTSDGGAPDPGVRTDRPAADAPAGAELMVRLRDGDGADHELWAYSTGRPCVVQTRIADGVRSMVGYDCEIGPDCTDAAWATFADIPPGSTRCDAGSLGDGLLEGVLTMHAAGSGIDEPVVVSSRLRQDVATWEIVPDDGEPIGPREPLRHPDDPDRAYLFATLDGGWTGLEIVTRDDVGDVIARDRHER